jgi:hypothetical protein
MTDSLRQQIITNLDVLLKKIMITSQVIGSDTFNYTCKLTHTAANDKKPITGGSWATYWTLTGSGGIAWVTGTSYNAYGCQTNLGLNVFAWRDTEKNPLASTELPGLVYRDQLSGRAVGCGVYDQTLRIDYEIYADSMATIRKALADVEKVLIADETLTGLADGSDLGAGEDIAVEHLEDKLFRAKDFIEIYFQTVRGDPTTKA